uniref:Uncharacterized protein n=1 Tax=Pyxicephalus adspersus TaxID=30357 RepID=A0AAV3A7M7_PYXAD|nr:TPA: hypothetical protein GDO54_014513 [Pyxicephalus adspersus]
MKTEHELTSTPKRIWRAKDLKCPIVSLATKIPIFIQCSSRKTMQYHRPSYSWSDNSKCPRGGSNGEVFSHRSKEPAIQHTGVHHHQK